MMASNYNCHTHTHTHTQSERKWKHFVKERDPKRETQTWFRLSSRRGLPRVSSSVAMARSGSTQMRLMNFPWSTLSLSLSLSLSQFLILYSFFVLYGFDLVCNSMVWCDWFDFIVFTLFQLVWLLRNRRKILEMEWIGYCVYGFISWVDLIWFDFFFF